MGNQHPLSLKLKHQKRWQSIIYKYTEEGSLRERNKQKIINKIITQKYKGRLITKPIYEYRGRKLKVMIYEYETRWRKRVREIGREELKREIRIWEG